jgi:hypothetical protein
MKRLVLISILAILTFSSFSQENLITLSGGWAWCNVDASDQFEEDPNIKGTGWRINGLYEFNPQEGKVSYGVSIGYISVKAEYSATGDSVAEYKVSTLPIYFAPKVMLGNETIKGFIKGALGVQSARIERTGAGSSLEGTDFGFYGGGGGGLMVFVHEKVFINAEYEIAYMSNSYYRGGLMQSVMAGIGLKL